MTRLRREQLAEGVAWGQDRGIFDDREGRILVRAFEDSDWEDVAVDTELQRTLRTRIERERRAEARGQRPPFRKARLRIGELVPKAREIASARRFRGEFDDPSGEGCGCLDQRDRL